MEEFKNLFNKSKQNLKSADHILSMTYPLIKDPKLLVEVIENLNLAIDNSMSSLLSYQRLFKRIPIYADSFDEKFEIFKRFHTKFGYENVVCENILLIKHIHSLHKNTPAEFSRKDKFVICSQDYKVNELTEKDLKERVEFVKNFVSETEKRSNLLVTLNLNPLIFILIMEISQPLLDIFV